MLSNHVCPGKIKVLYSQDVHNIGKNSLLFFRFGLMMVTDNFLVHDFVSDGCKLKQVRKKKRKCHQSFIVILIVVRTPFHQVLMG